MPPLSDNEAPQASEQEDPAALAATNDTAGDTPATGDPAASPAADEKAPKSLLDVVTDAVKPKESDEASSASEAEKPDAEAAPKDEPELTPEEIAKVPFNRHPRFQQILRERNTFKEEVAQFKAQINDLEGPATQFRNIDGYLKANEITGDEFVELVKLGALINQNPAQARQQLIQMLVGLDEVTGERIPADIQADVDTGAITEERARELSRLRATATAATKKAETATATVDRVTTETRSREAAAAISSAVDAWEARVRTDPDFEAKDQLVADRVTALNSRLGPAKTPEEAVKRCQDAWDGVTKELAALLPKKKEMRRSPESGSTVNVAPARPSSLQAALEQSLAR